jgi:hypothetical protein
MRFLLFSFLVLAGCASTDDAVKKAGHDKHVFFTISKSEGYEFLKMQGLQLRKLDSVREKTGKVYLFYYRDQQ